MALTVCGRTKQQRCRPRGLARGRHTRRPEPDGLAVHAGSNRHFTGLVGARLAAGDALLW